MKYSAINVQLVVFKLPLFQMTSDMPRSTKRCLNQKLLIHKMRLAVHPLFSYFLAYMPYGRSSEFLSMSSIHFLRFRLILAEI